MTGSLIHVDESLYSPDSEPANGSTDTNDGIYEGDLITRESGGGCHVTDPSTDTSVDGIVPHFDQGDHLPEHEYDFSTPVYEGDGTWDGSDWVTFARAESGAVFYPWSVKDTSEPAPNITKNDTVVVARIGGDTVVVEDGYTDSGSTTYSESNGNAIVLGEADLAVDSHETLVPVRVEDDPSR